MLTIGALALNEDGENLDHVSVNLEALPGAVLWVIEQGQLIANRLRANRASRLTPRSDASS